LNEREVVTSVLCCRLRAPKAPDDQADMGTHHFTYALMPHTGTLQAAGVVRAAYELNYPLHLTSSDVPTGKAECQTYFNVDTPAVILDTVKKVGYFVVVHIFTTTHVYYSLFYIPNHFAPCDLIQQRSSETLNIVCNCTISQAEKIQNAVVLRLFEAFGGHATAHVNINFKFTKVQL
jgi:alpha-mannosidase